MHVNRGRLAAASLTVVLTGLTGAIAATSANAHDGLRLTDVPAGVDVRGVTVPNVLSPQLDARVAAQGSQKLENPTADVPYYGYDGDGTLMPDPTLTQAPGHNVEASKTEPDKNS
jgi:hypothetical protein